MQPVPLPSSAQERHALSAWPLTSPTFTVEAELGKAYLPIKRAFNALENADAQENFLDAQQSTIINFMSRFHETSVGRLAA